ncbi:MAG TPA: PVC-type heme-binding CxxCH protein, partial [Pirellulaceae bacterium]|nr:PVC-type heme-binding CxxCH protein [Pirellulaceae bacterium]
SFIWGPDGWLYGCHGVFTHSQVGQPGAKESERVKINAGVWRYHPTRRVFERFAEGTSNPWGVDFNEHGQAFVTACVIPHLYHMIQGGRYQRQAGQHFNPHTYDDIKTIAKHRHWVGNQWNNADRAKSDDNGGGHAHAGAMLYLGGHWPTKYRNQLFMNNIHGARLNQDQLTASGSGYVGDGAPDFCLANDTWSQILYLTYGPDGNVTMIDWYDRNQCHHGNVPGHDRGNGRIFKINYGQTKPVIVDLKKLSDRELVELQLHANQWYVRHARRILQERATEKQLDTSVKTQLLKQFAAQDDPVKQLHCLWALHAIDQLDADFLREQLNAKAAPVRAWTVQLLMDGRYEAARDNALLTALAKNESSPLVRLYLAAALQRMPVAERWPLAQALVAHAEDAQDHNLPLLLWYGIEPLVMTDPAQAFALSESSQIPLVARYIARRAAADEAGYDALLTALAAAPEAKQLWMLEEIVAALQVRANTKMPQAWQTTYDRLLATKNAAILQQ